jgi:YfiH family protein
VTTTTQRPAAQPATLKNKPTALQIPALRKLRWLVHGFSTRPGGTSTAYGDQALNLGFTAHDARAPVERNRALLLASVGAGTAKKPWPVATVRQIHSDLIHVVRSPEPERPASDGLVTNVPEVALGVLTADCFPVLLVDKKNHAVGAFHAGWRGTVQRIAVKGLGIMRKEYGTDPGDVVAVVGPGIQKCCYEVGDELKAKFESQFAFADKLFHYTRDSDPVREKYPLLFMNMRAPGHGDLCEKLHLDLQLANRLQLEEAGVPTRQISTISDCTACNTRKFFSHRAEKGHTGRMMAVIGLKK